MFQVIVFERGDLIFVFNFHPENTYDGYFFFVQGVDYVRNIIIFSHLCIEQKIPSD